MHPNNPEIYLSRSYVYESLRDYHSAFQDIEQAVVLLLQDRSEKFLRAAPQVYRARGRYYFQQADFTQAIENFWQAINNCKKIQSNIELVAKEIGTPTDIVRGTFLNEEGQCHYWLGRSYHQQENYSQAVAAYSAAININRHQDVTYYNRALSLIKLAKFYEAIRDFDTALKLLADERQYRQTQNLVDDIDWLLGIEMQVLHERAHTYQHIGNREAVLADFQQALDLYQKINKHSQQDNSIFNEITSELNDWPE